MAEPILENCEGIVDLVAKSATTIDKGDLIGYSSGWVRANSYAVPGASVTATIPAQYIAMESISAARADGTNSIKACRKATMYDADAAFTAESPLYLYGAATATGGITHTRNTVAGYLVQVVGRAISTTRAILAIGAIKEWETFLTPDTYDNSGEPGLGVADAGWVGPSLTATEGCYFKGRLPENIVGTCEEASVILNSTNSSAGDIDVDVVAAFDGPGTTAVANNQDAGTTADGKDWAQTDADNKILVVDTSSLLDAGLWFPGRNFSVWFDVDATVNSAVVIGLQLRGWQVAPA